MDVDLVGPLARAATLRVVVQKATFIQAVQTVKSSEGFVETNGKLVRSINVPLKARAVRRPPKPAATKPAETKPAETKPTETKPAPVEKPVETKPAETKPADKPDDKPDDGPTPVWMK